MRVFRVVMAVLSGLVFLLVATVCVLAARVNETLLEEEFYVRQLRQADVYEFVYSDVLPPLIDDFASNPGGQQTVDLAAVKPQLLTAAKTAFPPEWLEARSEEGIRQVFPYLTGQTESFSVQVPLRGPVEGAGEAVKDLASDDLILDLLFDQVVAQRIREALATNQGQETSLPITTADLEPRLRKVLSNEWVEQQTVAAVDEIMPYLVGDADHFTVRLGIGEQRDELKGELQSLLAGWDSTAFFTQRALDPVLNTAVPASGYPVPFGLTIKREDVRTALATPAAQAWMKQQGDATVAAILDYVVGDAATLTITVPLDTVKNQVSAEVGKMLDARLEAVFNAARVCTADEERRLDPREVSRTGITCRPRSMTYQELKSAAGVGDFSNAVSSIAAGSLPATFTLQEKDIQAALGPGQWQAVQGVRTWFMDGITFTDRSLLEMLAANDYSENSPNPFDRLDASAKDVYIASSPSVKSFNSFRSSISEGLTYTHEDFREGMAGNDPSALQGLDEVRSSLGNAKTFGWLLWIVPIGSLLTVGAWGARSIAGKVVWGAAFLLALGVVLLIASGPVYSSARAEAVKQIEGSFEEDGRQIPVWERALQDKGVQVMGNAMDEYVRGIRSRGYLFAGLGLLAGAGGIWYLRKSAAPKALPPATA